jgi:transposase-like zinc ribbon protein
MEAIRFFSDPDACVRYFSERRWPEGPVRPKCAGKDHYYLTSRRLWKCKACSWFMLHRIRHAMQTGSFEKKTNGQGIDSPSFSMPPTI